jgi:hypothetical protein
LNGLIKATETSNELSKAIFKEVAFKATESGAVSDEYSSDVDASSRFSKSTRNYIRDDRHVRSMGGVNDKKLLRMIKSQSQLLDDHRKVLNSIENASKNLQQDSGVSQKEASDILPVVEQFSDGLTEYQNLITTLIETGKNIIRKSGKYF